MTYRTTFFKRCVTLICVFALFCASCIQTSSAAHRYKDAGLNDDYQYEIEWHNNHDFTITGYVDGKLFDMVSGSIGGEKLTVQTFDDKSTNTFSSSEVMEVDVSSIITEVTDSDSPTLECVISRTAYNSYAGYVKYRILAGTTTYYETLHVSYDIIDTNSVTEYELNAQANTNFTIILAAVISVVGFTMGGGILARIIIWIGGVISGGKITKGASGYFSGTQYDYNIKAENRAVSPFSSKTYSGKAFDGRYKVGNGAWKTGKAYEGYYPQFIREKDNAVATWLFNDFFFGTFDVYRWSTSI